MFRLLIADDEHYARIGIKSSINWSDIGVKIVGEARDGEEALQLAIEHKPDLILSDIRMPFMDGIELLEQVKKILPDCGFIILSGYSEFEYARQAIKHGAMAYLLKPIDRQQLMQTVMDALERLQVRQNEKTYYNMLSCEYSELQQQFLRNWVQGRPISSETAASRLVELGIPVIKGYYLLAVLHRKTEMAQMDSENVEDMFLRTRFTDHREENLLFQLSAQDWCVIAQISETDHIQKMVSEWRQITAELEKKTSDCYSVGISCIYHGLENITKAYDEAQYAAGVYGIPTRNCITAYQDTFLSCRHKEVREAVKYIKNHFFEDITAENAANLSGISASRLMHIFKNDLGTTFNNCVAENRTLAAIEIMEAGTYKIYEIAEMVGYTDVKYFSSVFKKVTGRTPSEYMRGCVQYG